jgi:hypothetical protein
LRLLSVCKRAGLTRPGSLAATAAVAMAVLAASIASISPTAAAPAPARSAPTAAHPVSAPTAKPHTPPRLDPNQWMTLNASEHTVNSVHIVGTSASSTLSVYSSLDVGPTPYYIEIFDVTKGTLVAACGQGTQCAATVSHGDSLDTHVAFISGYGSTLLPPNVRAASNSA